MPLRNRDDQTASTSNETSSTSLSYALGTSFGDSGLSVVLNIPKSGMRVQVSVHCFAGVAVLGAAVALAVNVDDGTDVPVAGSSVANTVLDGVPLSGTAIFTGLSAGNHTFKLRAKKTSALGTVSINGDANRPAYIRAMAIP